jgi:DNA-binding FadR family transcriptional regulator
MTDHAIIRLEAEFARTACIQRTENGLRVLRESVDRASQVSGAWETRAAAHAEFLRLLAYVTGGSAYYLLAQLISGSVRDIITRAGPGAGELISGTHRRLIQLLEARDAEGAAEEMERYLALLSHGEPVAVRS